MLMALCSLSYGQAALFNKYANTDGVTTVVVSKAMFRMMPDVKIDNRDIKKIANKIDQLRALTCERKQLIARIAKDAAAIYSRSPWQEMMRYKEGRTNTVIYMCPAGKGKHQFVLYTTELGELNIISIVGNLTLEDIRSITQ
jgi:hypothetical protein